MTLNSLDITSPNNTAEYLVAGIPFFQRDTLLSGSTARIDFDHVTQRVYVQNAGPGELRVAATENGLVGSNHLVLSASASMEMPWRIVHLYLGIDEGPGLNTNYQIVASLTSVRSNNPNARLLTELSASNGWNGLG